MQFERKANGILNSLPKKNIDTGMGLERLSAVLQGVDTPFETDLIKPVVDSLRGLARSKEQVLLNRIADHIRAICHLIADGVLPGNEERGYVLRNLIRRSVRVGKKLGIIDSPFLYKLATPVSEIFLYLKEKREHIARIIQIEEERFSDVFDRGLLILEEMAEKGRLSGEDLFKLHDTYGFPIDLAEEIAKEKGLLCDIEGFNRLMSEQRERARKKSAFEKRESKVSEETEFVGYRDLEIDAVVVKVTDSGIILDRTPFYPESGGEIGDTGFLIKEKEKAKVEDTQRAGKAILHKTKAILKEGDRVRAIVDAERRRGIEKAHTATHLLHSALRAIVGSSVKQAGSLVAEERLRFDFTHIKPLEEIEIRRAEEVVVEKIMEDIELEIREEDREEAKRMGAIALFEGAYQDRVRVVKISDFSMELCGGCHVKRTGEIGPFIILSETGVAAGIRRIEALVGLSAYRHISAERDRMKDVATALSVGEDRVVERMEELIRREREIERELSRYKAELLVRELLPKDVEKKRIICKKVEGLEKRELGEAVDRMASKIESGVVILVSVKDGGVLWACRVTKDLIERFDASEIVKDAAKMTGGGGGGRRDFATGGGKKVEKVDEAIKKAFEVIKERL
jgi:alanyl-tRNA synthetase